MTFAELIAALDLEIFPDRYAENLKLPVRAYYKEALAQLQRGVEVLQGHNVDVHPFKADYFKCGTTVICAPPGLITRVYTVGDDFCEPLTYPRVNYDELYQWSRKFTTQSGSPDNTGLPTLGLGFKFPKNSTDGQYGRALRGCYAYHKGNIYVAPWIQSFESVVIEWDGIKRTWSDADIVSSGPLNEDTWKQAIKAWVFGQKSRYWDKDYAAFQAAMGDFGVAQANLIEDSRNIAVQTLPSYEVSADVCMVSMAEARRVAANNAAGITSPPTEVPVLYGIIGDYGLAGADELAVSSLVKSWSPDIVLTTGDNNYQNGAANTIDENIGQYYRTFIKDYQGSYPLLTGESDATTNRFYPVIGNHDLDFGFPPTPYTDYFPALPGNKRYFSFVWGLVEFFMLDSGFNTAGVLVETAGNTSVSAQAQWLQARMAASIAKYKVVVLHHSPYMSASNYTPGITQLRWPFKQFGADLVIGGHGHNLEVLEVDDLKYVVNGAGGAALTGFGAPIDGSEFRYSTKHGAVRLSVVCDAMTVQLFNVDGTNLYEFDVTNDNPILAV